MMIRECSPTSGHEHTATPSTSLTVQALGPTGAEEASSTTTPTSLRDRGTINISEKTEYPPERTETTEEVATGSCLGEFVCQDDVTCLDLGKGCDGLQDCPRQETGTEGEEEPKTPPPFLLPALAPTSPATAQDPPPTSPLTPILDEGAPINDLSLIHI